MTTAEPDSVLSVTGLSKTFRTGRGRRRHEVRAVVEAACRIGRGETFGLVGESGSGKSTLARLVSRLIEPDSGTIMLGGTEFSALAGSELRAARRHVQMVFQDPYSSLDPSWTVGDIVAEPIRVHERVGTAERGERVVELLRSVELDGDVAGRYPHEFSGGQRQRIALARALALSPQLIICDEAVSALDVSTQAAVLNLLSDLQRERGLAYLFISHDLAVVRHIADRVAVMYRGSIVEVGQARTVSDHPLHPYSQLLRDSVPVIAADPPVPPLVAPARRTGAAEAGCPFVDRCPAALDVCSHVMPPLAETSRGHWVACHAVELQVRTPLEESRA
ncbi:MAG TPA: oligopeptide/dipeptide ABC transporter ATP-binding protein [Ilumatobacter sp.]|nr:oligopeptide/dipeptide ABC transporter ATP-binding protein [Ilumatobacter sp.]